jgi:hypothetical protein
MAELLREAEASRARAAAAPAPAQEASKRVSDAVEIFSKGRRQTEREEAVGGSPLAARAAAEAVYASGAAAGVSVRREGELPAHPSASTFRLGHFLRSWQGSVGALLLLAACGVAVFALLRSGATPRDAAQPAPTPPAPQAATQQTPAPAPPTPEPSPAFPTPDAQGIVPVADQGYPVPNTTGQPFYVTTGPAASPVTSNAPGELTVVSESGSAPARDDEPAGRRPGAEDSAPARDANAGAPRTARTPEPAQTRPAPPSAAPNQTPPPAPQPTPGRAKVIQWPPQ